MKKRLALPGLCVLIATLFMAGYIHGQTYAVMSPDVEPADEMAFVPDDCGILADTVAIDPMIPNAVGASPIWLSVPDEGEDPKGILYVPNEHNQENPQLEGWWYTKVAWFIPLTYTGEVQISGFNVEDNSPMYFEFDDDGPAEVGTLNPAEPGGFVEELVNWAFFPSYVWISKAGCYQIEAEWDGGAWRQIIAAGNIEFD